MASTGWKLEPIRSLRLIVFLCVSGYNFRPIHDMTQYRHHTKGTVTTNKKSIQLYFDVQFSRSPRNPLRGAQEYAAFCDSGVVVVFPIDRLPAFPLEVAPPTDFDLTITNP